MRDCEQLKTKFCSECSGLRFIREMAETPFGEPFDIDEADRATRSLSKPVGSLCSN